MRPVSPLHHNTTEGSFFITFSMELIRKKSLKHPLQWCSGAPAFCSTAGRRH